MTPLTQEWVQKAEADYAALEWLRQAPDSMPDALGFHAQQCVEKYLKARAQHAGIAFPRTHDLEQLLTLVLPVEPGWAVLRADLAFLSRFAVEVRYPGIESTPAEGADAVRICRVWRSTIRASLGLTP